MFCGELIIIVILYQIVEQMVLGMYGIREDEDGDSFDKMLGSPFELCWGKRSVVRSLLE